MRSLVLQVLLGSLFAWLALGCVDPEELVLNGTVDIIVVDGTVTNLAEPQVIRLNYSRADRLTGRFGTLPITKAKVEVVRDSSVVILAHETTNGIYQLPGSPVVVNIFTDNTPRPPTALCAPVEQRTPFKPEGWPD